MRAVSASNVDTHALKLFRHHCVRSSVGYLYHCRPRQPNAFRHKQLTIRGGGWEHCEIPWIEVGDDQEQFPRSRDVEGSEGHARPQILGTLLVTLACNNTQLSTTVPNKSGPGQLPVASVKLYCRVLRRVGSWPITNQLLPRAPRTGNGSRFFGILRDLTGQTGIDNPAPQRHPTHVSTRQERNDRRGRTPRANSAHAPEAQSMTSFDHRRN